MNEHKNYYPLLDVLRFVAATFVMLFHYFSTSLSKNDDALSRLITHGYMGVELFFIISGFVIYNSLKASRSVDGSSNDNLDYKSYIWSRFIRLYPLFWILCTITYILTITLGDEHLPFYKYLLNLLIVNNGKTANMMDGSYWTLTIEIMFYIYIGIFAYIFKKKNLIYFFTLWLAYSYISFYFGFSEALISKLLLVRYSPYFVFGGVLAILYEKRNTLNLNSNLNFRQRINKIIMNPILLYYIFILHMSFFASHYFSNKLNELSISMSNSGQIMSNQFGIFNHDTNIIINYVFLIALLSVQMSSLIRSSKTIIILQYIGLATYPLYLLHQKVGYLFLSQFTTFGILNIYSIVAVMLIISISIYIGIIDKDMRKYLTNKFYKSSP